MGLDLPIVDYHLKAIAVLTWLYIMVSLAPLPPPNDEETLEEMPVDDESFGDTFCGWDDLYDDEMIASHLESYEIFVPLPYS